MELGIDFGTTRTVVAASDRGNHPVIGFADAIGDVYEWIPTVAAEREGQLRYGFDALAVAGDEEWTAVRSFKRLLTSALAGPAQRVLVGTAWMPLGDVVTGFLSHVRDAILERSDVRTQLGRGGALRAAVAVPANAHGAARLVTLDAFRRAGFEVAVVLNEPSAAGFEYSHRHRDTLSSRRDVVAVYDLGGGTFDASVVRMMGRHHEVLATAGVPRLGGDDFDDLLADLVLSRARVPRPEVPDRALAALLEQCRQTKESLNPASRKITIDLEALLGQGAPAEVVLPVAEFYEACEPLVGRTIEAMLPIMSRVNEEEALRADIAGVYVVGGGSELPVVARALRARFGRRVHRSPHSSAAVAIGLSIAADSSERLELVDRYARTFGVFREGERGQKVTYDSIFTPDTELPVAGRGEPLTRTRRYRAAHNVGHYRFFECSAFDEGGAPRGDMSVFADVYFPFDTALRAASDLSRVPVERRWQDGPEIVESYALTGEGIVDIRIREEGTGHERSYRLGGA